MKSGAGCCDDKSCEIAAMTTSHRRVLWLVLAINAVMFVVEGWILNSSLGVLRAAIRDFRKPIPPVPQPMKPVTIRFSKSGR
jgi:ABC-type branched-subunit amino acid transport system permease subunit